VFSADRDCVTAGTHHVSDCRKGSGYGKCGVSSRQQRKEFEQLTVVGLRSKGSKFAKRNFNKTRILPPIKHTESPLPTLAGLGHSSHFVMC
jgi:hypothetical protein